MSVISNLKTRRVAIEVLFGIALYELDDDAENAPSDQANATHVGIVGSRGEAEAWVHKTDGWEDIRFLRIYDEDGRTVGFGQ